MNTKIISFCAVVSFFLVACEASMPSNKSTGAVLGGVAGGVAGSQIGKGKGRDVAMVLGTLLGAGIGGAIGQSMDTTDAVETGRALESTTTGNTVAWSNPDTGNEYEVTPTNTFKTSTGQNCREYTTIAKINGQQEKMNGTACRQADGSWKAN